ncbi:MAG TPA: hypothetical protein PLD87_13060 [Bacteroidia bacterium]|nr:hypothetical protein [Bacteroidia bacterium]
MNLVIDIGNTRIKAAVFDGKKLIACHIIKSLKKKFFNCTDKPPYYTCSNFFISSKRRKTIISNRIFTGILFKP